MLLNLLVIPGACQILPRVVRTRPRNLLKLGSGPQTRLSWENAGRPVVLLPCHVTCSVHHAHLAPAHPPLFDDLLPHRLVSRASGEDCYFGGDTACCSAPPATHVLWMGGTFSWRSRRCDRRPIRAERSA